MRRLLGWAVLLSATLVVLHRLGGRLAPPPLGAPSELSRWLAERAPAEALMALVRLGALAVAWYLLAATALAVVARRSGHRALVSFASAVSVPLVRRMVGGALGLSLAATTLAGAAATGTAGAQPAGATTTTTAVIMQRLGDAAPEGAPAAPPPMAGPEEARTWEVQPGQHFWAVAEQVLAQAWSRAAADDEVDRYWRPLVEANRSVLRDRDNPDLLYPGQVLTVPPPPPSPG